MDAQTLEGVPLTDGVQNIDVDHFDSARSFGFTVLKGLQKLLWP